METEVLVKAIDRPSIEIEGDVAIPQARYAKERGVCDAAIRRMRLPGMMYAGVKYIFENASQRVLAERALGRDSRKGARRRAPEHA